MPILRGISVLGGYRGDYGVEEGEYTNAPTAELIEDDEEEHMELEQEFWSLPGQFYHTAQARHNVA